MFLSTLWASVLFTCFNIKSDLKEGKISFYACLSWSYLKFKFMLLTTYVFCWFSMIKLGKYKYRDSTNISFSVFEDAKLCHSKLVIDFDHVSRKFDRPLNFFLRKQKKNSWKIVSFALSEFNAYTMYVAVVEILIHLYFRKNYLSR